MVALSTIGSQQASVIKDTNKVIHQLLNYCVTYSDDGIVYQSSNMVLAEHSDTDLDNEMKSRSKAGAHIYLSKGNPIP